MTQGSLVQAEAHRGRSAPGGHQPRVRPRKVASATATRLPCTCGGRGARLPPAALCCSPSSSMIRPPTLSKFPTEEEQKAERERLHDIISRLVVWENIHDEELLRGGARGDPQVDRRESAADPGPVRRRRLDPA